MVILDVVGFGAIFNDGEHECNLFSIHVVQWPAWFCQLGLDRDARTNESSCPANAVGIIRPAPRRECLVGTAIEPGGMDGDGPG